MIHTFNSHKYYAKRGKFLLDVSDGKLTHISEIRVAFGEPEVGWIDMSIYVDGVKKSTINWSDVFDPSKDMVEWLKDILSYDKSLNQLVIDQESSKGILTYEEYGVKEVAPDYTGAPRDKDGKINADFKRQRKIEAYNNRIQLGLFTVYETYDDSMPVQVIVSERQLVSAIYLGLLTYAATFPFTDFDKSFSSNWDFHCILGNEYYDDDDNDERIEYHRKGQWTFYNIIKSPEIELKLYEGDGWGYDKLKQVPGRKVCIQDYIIMWSEWGGGLFWQGKCCGNADKIYLGDKVIDLTDIAGLRHWYEEFDESTPEDPWNGRKRNEWMNRGRLFAFEIRKRLPEDIDLFYYWLPFKHRVEGLPEVMEIIPNIPIRKYRPL